MTDAAIKYFHEISNADWEAMQQAGTTWVDIDGKYLAPSWCGIGEEAVDPMGCWSLVSTRRIRSEKDCVGCPEYEALEKSG